MGFIRGSLLVFVCIILFIVLLIGNTFFVLSSSLTYKNVQKELGPILKDFTESELGAIDADFSLTEKMDEAKLFMEEHCQNESSYVFAEGGYTFVLPCDVLEEIEENPSAMINQGIDNIIEQIYYDTYDCKFWNCFKTTGLPFFLISEKAKNYWQDKFYLALIAFAVLAVLIFLLVESKPNAPLVVGSLIVVSSLPLLKLEKIVGSISGDSALIFVGIFFNKVGTVFWIVFIVGLILILAGIALKILSWNFLKEKIFRKKISKKNTKNISKKKK